MKEETYVILRLSKEDAIKQTSEKCNREQVFYQIAENDILRNLFPDDEKDLKLRPKAADFVRWRDSIYAVLYLDSKEKKVKSLFLFTVVYNSFYGDGSISEIQLCRCLGTNAVKRHRDFVENLIKGSCKFMEASPKCRYWKTTFGQETPAK